MTGHDCPVCGDTFSTTSGLEDHCWDLHGACHHCGREFDDRGALFVHWLTTHDDQISSRDLARVESSVGKPTFRDRVVHQGPASAFAGTTMRRRTLLAGGILGVGSILGGMLLIGSSGGGKRLSEHAAATALGDQPALGPPPADAEGTIIAFEDPSCPSCARFERRTFPRLKSELIDTGRLSFVFRGIPVVRQWSEPATFALEATYDRSTEAFWALKNFYYREQGSIGTDNVRDVTRQFLAEQTDVDASAVIGDVDATTVRDAVDTDLAASQDAGVRGTPTFFLFRDGAFATEIIGPQSFDVFANSLGM